jgi:hypothetical protein
LGAQNIALNELNQVVVIINLEILAFYDFVDGKFVKNEIVYVKEDH